MTASPTHPQNPSLKPPNPREKRPGGPATGTLATPGDGWIEFARVGKPHGLKGGFFLLTDDRRTAWDGYQDLRLEVERGFLPWKVTKAYVSGGVLAVMLDPLATRELVESFLGARLFVHRNEIKVDEGETLVSDLTGLAVVDENGVARGTVEGVVSFGAQDNLVIRVPGRAEEVLFPYVDAFVTAIDKEKRTVHIRYEPTFFDE